MKMILLKQTNKQTERKQNWNEEIIGQIKFPLND